MAFRFLADCLVLLHAAFVLYAILGGLLAIRWRWTMWLHLPTVVWVAAIEFAGWICPLTPLENWLRMKGDEAGYTGGFVEHYVFPVLYPAGLTPTIQIWLGVAVIALNAVVYWVVFQKRSMRKE